MFEVQSHKLVNALVERTKDLQQKLTAQILQDHQDINKKFVSTITMPATSETGLYNYGLLLRLCDEFENISRKMIIPSDMQELMELKVQIQLVNVPGSNAQHNIAPFPPCRNSLMRWRPQRCLCSTNDCWTRTNNWASWWTLSACHHPICS